MRVFATLLAGILFGVFAGSGQAQSEFDVEQAAGFVSLFTDSSFDGWHGNTTAWVMDKGRLVYTAPTRPSGSKALLDLFARFAGARDGPHRLLHGA